MIQPGRFNPRYHPLGFENRGALIEGPALIVGAKALNLIDLHGADDDPALR